MDKIASPQDLQNELRRLLAYSETAKPSRSKLASALRGLADRVAAPVPSKRKVEEYLTYSIGNEGEDWNWLEWYSGRGMHGIESPMAFDAKNVSSQDIKALQRMGFSYDSMGRGYVFFVRA